MDKSTGSGKFNIANEFEINHFDKAGVPMCIDYVIAKSLRVCVSDIRIIHAVSSSLIYGS
jgi:hypothetical protein